MGRKIKDALAGLVGTTFADPKRRVDLVSSILDTSIKPCYVNDSGEF